MDSSNRRQIAFTVAVLFGIIAVAAGNLAMLLWAVAVGAIAVAAWAWVRMAWDGVTIEASFQPARAFVGEPVFLRVTMANAKRLPLPLVRLGVWFPPGLYPAAEGGSSAIRGYARRLYLAGRSKATLELPVRVIHRGEFWLERIDVEVSDPFDLTPLRRNMLPDADLLVMPEPRIEVPVEVRRRLPFGQPARTAVMYEERERFAGVRPYESGDPLNRIHWKLTGHAGGLQTKLFEPTRSADVMLVLDLSVGEPFWDAVYPEIAEDTIGWASFLARVAIDGGWRIGLMANTHLTRGRGPLRIPPSSVNGHEAAVFAALARMPNEPTSDLGPVLREEGRRMSRNTTTVILSPRPGPRLRHEMAVLRRRGLEVLPLSPLEAALAREAGA